jgi:3-hydroxyacyl-CoA dehydrogenase
MARNIGDFFLEKGLSVHWVTSSPEQRAELLQRITKTRRRMTKFFPERLGQFDAACHLLATDGIPLPDVIIESTHESSAGKKEVLASLSPLITERTLIFSNSSSLLPRTLHRNCLGAHFFYPVQLTACIELIIPETCHEQRRRESLRFFQENGCDVLEQDEKNAFMVNRLLLPLQAACLGALQDGYPAKVVDEASKSDLIGLGQLSIMDAIGLDLIHTAAANYRNLAEKAAVQADHDLLLSGLERLLNLGKRGIKNGDGLLIGRDLPWPNRKVSAEERQNLQKHLGNTLKEACLQAYRQQNITLDQLQIVCERIFQARGFSGMFFAGTTGKNEKHPSIF